MKTQDIISASQKYGSRFANWMAFVLDWECVYDKFGDIISENDPSDSGGLTFAGIDRRSHPDFDYDNPTAEAVSDIYHDCYWKPSQAETLGFPVGEVVANFSVNMGRKAAVKLLQASINKFTPNQLNVDGIIGPMTLAYTVGIDPKKLASSIDEAADARYRAIVSEYPKNKKFLKGWKNRNDALEEWWEGLS